MTPWIHRKNLARGRALAFCLTVSFSLILPLLTVSGCASGGQGKFVIDPLPDDQPLQLPLTRAEVAGNWTSRPTQIFLPTPLPDGSGSGFYSGGSGQTMVLSLSVSPEGGMTGTLAGGNHEAVLTGTCAEDGTFRGQMAYFGTTFPVRGRFGLQGTLVNLYMDQEGVDHGLFYGVYYLDRR